MRGVRSVQEDEDWKGLLPRVVTRALGAFV